MGHIFKTAVPDESDEVRRELERCVIIDVHMILPGAYVALSRIRMVSEAATGKSKHHHMRAAARTRRDGKCTPPKDGAEQAEKPNAPAQ